MNRFMQIQVALNTLAHRPIGQSSNEEEQSADSEKWEKRDTREVLKAESTQEHSSRAQTVQI